MGTAILKGLLTKTTDDRQQQQGNNNNNEPSVSYTAWVRSRTSLERLHRALGEGEGEDQRERVRCVSGGGDDDIVETVRSADIVILGFPPGELNAVFGGGSETGTLSVDALRGKLIVSLLAGVSYEQLGQSLATRYLHHEERSRGFRSSSSPSSRNARDPQHRRQDQRFRDADRGGSDDDDDDVCRSGATDGHGVDVRATGPGAMASGNAHGRSDRRGRRMQRAGWNF